MNRKKVREKESKSYYEGKGMIEHKKEYQQSYSKNRNGLLGTKSLRRRTHEEIFAEY